jgi:hypothetical protein
LNSIESYIIYFKTVVKSKVIREGYLDRYGLEKTTHRFNTVSGKPLFMADEIQKVILEGIQGKDPFFVGRFGSIELYMAAKTLLNINHKKQMSLNVLCNNAGFFPNSMDKAEEFGTLMQQAMNCVDVQGTWYLPFEDYAIKHWLCKNAMLTEGRYLEPWFSSNPWTSALAGKNILVIHPFVDSIRYQYEHHRRDIFSNEDYLPDFNLLTLKAVQTIANTKDDRFDTWFDALDYMYNEALKLDFDVALIGCGAYGYPLAAKLKMAGKKAIHMGGVLQAMFGIKGKRWETDKNPIVKNLYNDYWIRPSENEVPQNNSKVENGCYW